ncbi:MAG: nucleotide exchange factor GrpE [Candidatus Atribacteria bacterium]|nr:nucleotide exchange factor GrpE [Candidatus Atribacteria bacterium]
MVVENMVEQSEGMSEKQQEIDQTPHVHSEESGVNDEKKNQQEFEELQKIAEENRHLAEEYLKNLKALKAEFENSRRREMIYRQNFVKSANKELILEFLPVMDDMEKAIQESKKSEVQNIYIEGAELIYRKFLSILEKEGVRQIQTIGGTFDPKYQEAIMTVSLPECKDYEIVEEFRKGYIYHDDVIRAAQVKVNRLIDPQKES